MQFETRESTIMMIEPTKFNNSNTTFAIIIHFENSIDFEGYCFNNVSSNYCIAIVQFQWNNMNNKTMILSTFFGIYSANFKKGFKARINMVSFIFSQDNIINIVNNLNILQFLGHFFADNDNIS